MPNDQLPTTNDLDSSTMTQPIEIECGDADEFGRRVVAALCGDQLYRDRFNTDDAFRRQRFAEAALAEFRQPVVAEVLAEIGAMIVGESAARDARPASPLQPIVTRLDDVAAREGRMALAGPGGARRGDFLGRRSRARQKLCHAGHGGPRFHRRSVA